VSSFAVPASAGSKWTLNPYMMIAEQSLYHMKSEIQDFLWRLFKCNAAIFHGAKNSTSDDMLLFAPCVHHPV